MPGYIYKPMPFPGSSLSVNYTQGWNNRTIYQFFGSPGALYDYRATEGVYDTNIFEGIANYSFPGNLQSYTYRGAYSFQPWFFTTGKQILIKGALWISTAGSGQPILKMNIGSSSNNYGKSAIAVTNKGDDHYAIRYLNDAAVNFEILLTSIQSYQKNVSTDAEKTSVFFQASGNVTYDSDASIGPKTNTNAVYIPFYPTSFDQPSADLWGTDQNVELYIDFEGSDRITSIKVQSLSMREFE